MDDAIRQTSPELINPTKFGLKESHPTKESDCYALGMVIYEVLSGWTPFYPYEGLVVVQMVLDGERPKRPQGDEGKLFTDGIWGTLELCWKPQPHDRISAKTVLLSLEGSDREVETNEDGAVNDPSTLSPLRLRLQAHFQPSLWHNRSINFT